MKPMKTFFASLAAAGLLVPQPLGAASARSGPIDGQSEELAGYGGSGVAVAAVLAVAVAAL